MLRKLIFADMPGDIHSGLFRNLHFCKSRLGCLSQPAGAL